ncbi:MAG: AsmA family protein [Burkholderiales bacterium]
MRVADGRSNWPQDAAETGIPSVGLLRIERGKIEIADDVLDTHLEIAFKGRESTDGPTSVNAAYETTATGRYHGLPLKLEARSGAALPLLGGATSDINELQMVPLKVIGSVGRAQIDFDGEALALFGSPRIDGLIKLRAGSLGRVGDVLGLTLPETAPFRLRGRLEHELGEWRLRDVQMTVGHSQVGGDYRFDTRVNPPLLSGKLQASRIRLADLGPAVGVAADEPAGKDGKVLPARRFDLPSLAAMDANVQASVDELDFGTPTLRPILDLRTHVVLAKSVLRLEDMQARAGGGSLSGMSQLDGRKGAADWLAELRFDGLEVAKWIAGVRKPDAKTNVANEPSKASPPDATVQRPATAYLTGKLDGRMKVRGSGTSTAGILASLDGDAQATIRNGTISHLTTELMGIDVAQALGVAIRGDDALPLHCARLDVKIENGIVVPRVAVLDNRDSTVRMTGSVNLRDEALDLHLTTSPKDFSPLTLRAPVFVKGTLGAPRVGLDAGPLVARVAASVVLGVIATPLAALLPLIDPGSKEEGDPCAMQVPPASPAASQAGARIGTAQHGTAKPRSSR